MRQNKINALTTLAAWMENLALPPLAPERMENLWLFFTELVKWSAKMNLIARAPELQILETHFLDSLTLLPLLETKNDAPPLRLLDVGTGAGFPGLVLKMARPETMELFLVEPRQKRVSFLRHVIRTAKLTNVSILNERLEPDSDFAEKNGPFSCITSRALADVSDFLALTAAIAPPNGTVICMKGPRADEEIKQWRARSPASPFSLLSQQKITLPHSGSERSLLVFQKAA